MTYLSKSSLPKQLYERSLRVELKIDLKGQHATHSKTSNITIWVPYILRLNPLNICFEHCPTRRHWWPVQFKIFLRQSTNGSRLPGALECISHDLEEEKHYKGNQNASMTTLATDSDKNIETIMAVGWALHPIIVHLRYKINVNTGLINPLNLLDLLV